MSRNQYHRRSTNPLFILFRLILSLIIFAALLGGIYSAYIAFSDTRERDEIAGDYKHFSGLDPLKLNPEAVFKDVLIALKLNQKVLGDQKIIPADRIGTPQAQTKVVFRFMMVADSHNDNKNLAKALKQAKILYPDLKFILGLGDYTDVGTLSELKAAKAELDLSSLRYFLAVGDHDLWDARDKQSLPFSDEKGKNFSGASANFYKVFGPTFQSFSESGFNFIILDNSDNYLGLSDAQLKWLDSELEKAKQQNSRGIFVFLHEPLYHPSSDHVMGRVEPSLKRQATNLIYTLKAAGVRVVAAGDTHYFSYYEQMETHMPMVTIGAITSERNVQTPRFGIGEVLDDGNLKVEDVEIR